MPAKNGCILYDWAIYSVFQIHSAKIILFAKHISGDTIFPKMKNQ